MLLLNCLCAWSTVADCRNTDVMTPVGQLVCHSCVFFHNQFVGWVVCLLLSPRKANQGSCIALLKADLKSFKGNSKQRSIMGCIDRKGIKNTFRSSWFLVQFVKNQCLKVSKTWPWVLPFVSGGLYPWHPEQGWRVWQKWSWCHEPAFLCSSSVKSKPTWLCPLDLKLKMNEKHFCCISVEGTTVWRHQWKYLHFLYAFRPVCVVASGPL